MSEDNNNVIEAHIHIKAHITG